MDTELLVEAQIGVGQRLVEQLVRDGFEVSVAFWAKTSEEGLWHFFLASPSVDEEKRGESYRKVYSYLESITGSWISPSDLTLINDQNPIARDAIEVRDRHPAQNPTKYYGKQLGGLPIKEAYIYPPITWLCLSFKITYYRHGDTNKWRTITKCEGVRKDLWAKGAVSYSTALREGEKPEDAIFATVWVLLELDPQFDDPAVLDQPVIRQELTERARKMADERFKLNHPDAEIEHTGDEG